MNFRRSVINALLWRPEVARRWNVRNFCFFYIKTTPYACSNYQNSVPKVFITTPIDIVVFKLCKIWPTGNLWNHALFTRPKKQQQNFNWLSNCCYCADHAQNLPGPAPNNVGLLRVLQISSKSVYFRQSYSRTREHRQIPRRVNPIFSWSLASSHNKRAHS